MPLDNAQFIAELSVTDPPGTDPLNQGDDHIRTIKLAVQQSFPNVGSAVPQTGVQMAQMAIKNEVNIFTQVNTFQQPITFNAENVLRGGSVPKGFSFFNVADTFVKFQVGMDTSERYRIARFDSATGTFLERTLEIGQTTGIAKWQSDSGATFAMQFNQTGGTGAQLRFLNNDLLRWSTGGSGADQENWRITRFDDLGAFLDNPLDVSRADGKVLINTALKLVGDAGGGNLLDMSGEGGSGFPGFRILSTTGLQRFNLFLFQSNNTIQMDAFDAAGVSNGTILTINLTTRVVDFKVAPTVNGSPI